MTTQHSLNQQSGNKVVTIDDEGIFAKYHERLSSELAIAIEGSTDSEGYECYRPRISRTTELDTHLEPVYTCLDDALAQVEQYLESIGITWGFNLTGK